MQVKQLAKALVVLMFLALVVSARASDWTTTYRLSDDGSLSRAVATTIDANGNTYVLATCTNDNDSENIVVLRYGPNGEHNQGTDEWLYDPGVHAEAVAFVLKDNTGTEQDTLFVLGDTAANLQSGLRAYVTLKFIYGQSDPAWIWTTGVPGNDNRPAGIALVPQGSFTRGAWVAVTGTTWNGPNNASFYTDRFNSDGTEPSGWPVQFHNGTRTHAIDTACGVTVDLDGGVYVAGTTNSDLSEYNYDFCTVNYAPNGYWNGTPWVISDVGDAGATRIGRHGNQVFVAGIHTTPPAPYLVDSVRVVEYNQNGSQAAYAAYADKNDDDDPVSVTLADMVVEDENIEGDVHWVGASDGDSPLTTYAYDDNLGPLWTKGARHYGTEGADEPVAVAADFWQNSYVVGNVPDEISGNMDITS